MSVTEMPSTQFPKEERHVIRETFADPWASVFSMVRHSESNFVQPAWTRRNLRPPNQPATDMSSRESC